MINKHLVINLASSLMQESRSNYTMRVLYIRQAGLEKKKSKLTIKLKGGEGTKCTTCVDNKKDTKD